MKKPFAQYLVSVGEDPRVSDVIERKVLAAVAFAADRVLAGHVFGEHETEEIVRDIVDETMTELRK